MSPPPPEAKNEAPCRSTIALHEVGRNNDRNALARFAYVKKNQETTSLPNEYDPSERVTVYPLRLELHAFVWPSLLPCKFTLHMPL